MRLLKVGSRLPAAEQKVPLWMGMKFAATSQGFDLGVSGLGPVPFQRLQAVAVCVTVIRGSASLVLLLVFQGLERPFVVEAIRVAAPTFGVTREPLPEANVRQVVTQLVRKLPGVVIDDGTYEFLKGQPPRDVGPRIVDLAAPIVRALEHAARAKPAPAPAPPPNPTAAPAPAAPSPPPPAAAPPPPAAAPPPPIQQAFVEQQPVRQPAAPPPAGAPPAVYVSRESPCWYDDRKGSLVYLTAKELLSARVRSRPIAEDILRYGYDPRVMKTVKSVVVPFRRVTRVTTDSGLGRAEIFYTRGDSAKGAAKTASLRIPYHSEASGALLVQMLQKKLGGQWTRRKVQKGKGRLVPVMLAPSLVTAVPFGALFWYLWTPPEVGCALVAAGLGAVPAGILLVRGVMRIVKAPSEGEELVPVAAAG